MRKNSLSEFSKHNDRHLAKKNKKKGVFHQYSPSSQSVHLDVEDDEYLENLVHQILVKHPDIDAEQIQIDCHDGVVLLSGYVKTRRIKRLIEDVIYGLPHVYDVQNQIEVSRS